MMNERKSFIARHSRLMLISLLTVTLLVSSEMRRRQLETESTFTALPVAVTTSVDAVQVYIADRDAAHDRDIAALLALTENGSIDEQTRQAAAQQLTCMAANREHQQALEAALASSALAPCAAVVTGSSVTIVTGKAEITQEDSALVLALAAAHAGASPSDVRIMTVP